MRSPEELAREKIDKLLTECGWILQNRSTINLSAGQGIAIREALLRRRDEVDYLLFVDGKSIDAVSVCESDKTDSRPLDRKPTEKLGNILLGVAFGKPHESRSANLTLN